MLCREWGALSVSWQRFIENAQPGEHAVQILEAAGHQADALASYVAAAVRSDAPAVVISRADHWQSLARELDARGLDPSALQRQRLLTYRNAEDTLEELIRGGSPDSAAFMRVIGGLLDDVATLFPGQTIRAFGEMVDVLWARGEEQAALAVEELWHDLARTRRFALLCSYCLDIFELDVQQRALPDIFRVHSHARPTTNPARLGEAVHRALTDVAGPRGAARVYLDMAERMPATRLPRGQAVLNWLSGTNAQLARMVLERARSHYALARVAA
jgi:MEDS: MEthanogen/methylotroph, DcmR Sensory domain